jgi:hypothetical protein
VSSTSLARETDSRETASTSENDAPVLAIPEGWVVDDLSRERLARQLARAPEHISGVVAETSALPSGTSYRVHAERLGLQPRSVAIETSGRAWQGAVLVRPGVTFEVQDGIVEVDARRLLVDPGAHVHDPWRAVAPLEDASAVGRPPFPRRPVVVFLACEPEVEALDWARSLVNNLVRRDVEGRLAMLDTAEGLHLTQQCLPSEASIRVLSPDVIVALDQGALEQVPAWCDHNRSAVAVEYTPDVAATAELVSWQLERARGRLRARIGRRLDAPSLVSLVNRLCSGPHPMPPSDTAVPSTATAVRAILKRKPAPIPEPAARRSVVVVTGDGDAPGHHVLEGLVDHLVGAGHVARVCSAGERNSSTVRDADVVLIGSRGNDADFAALIEARRTAGRPTISNIEPVDILLNTSAANESLQLAPGPARLAASCGRATTGTSAVQALLRTLDLRTHLLPSLLTRELVAELRGARSGGRGRSSESVVGWSVGAVGTPTPDYAEAVAEGLLVALSERSHLSVEIVGDHRHVPDRFLAEPRVRALPDRPGADALTRWTAHLWSPPLLDRCIAADTFPLVEAGAVGVPTVLPDAILPTVGGYPSPGLLVEDLRRADGWADALRLLLDDDATAATQSRAAMRRFDTTHGPAAADVAVNRFLGWALYRDEHA